LKVPQYFIVLLTAALFNLLCTDGPALSDESKASKKRHYDLNATSNSFELGTQESVLAWEKWHHHVSKLLSQRINHAIGRLMGTAVLHVKIDRDQNVTAEVVMSSRTPEFGQKCLEGVTSLNKEAALKFPEGSKRTEISFNLTFKRSPFTIYGLKFPKNDYERLNEQ
jgi:outer membrane biosynthesis protein TonB